MSYKLIYGSQMILRLVDNAVIPPSWGNQDYRAYQDWLAAGNTPEPADPPPDPGPQIDYTAAETAQTGFRALPNWATWTPAEGKVYVQAMILSKSGSPDLWVADIDGGNLRQLTTTKEDESSPCWSPDGTRICFASRQSGRPALYTIPASGGRMSALAVGAPSPTEPDWSPDGKFIIFTAQTGAGFQIYLAPLEGPSRGRSIPIVAGQDPVWAPNSRTVIFARTENHRRILALLDVPSKQTKDIAPINGSASEPSWAR